MTLLILSLMVALAMAVGALVIAVVMAIRHGDTSATYALYAVRDKVVAKVAFDSLRRDDPWLEAIYRATNTVLLGAATMSGPVNWPRAQAAGRALARRPGGPAKDFFPDQPLPDSLRPLFLEFQHALLSLQRRHLGWGLFQSAHRREQARMRREQARKMQEHVRQVSERARLATC